MALPARTRLIVIVASVVSLLTLVGAGVVRAGSGPSLPAIEADRLLATTARALAGPVTISGDVETRVDLGLPEIPSSLGGEGGPIAMVSGAQRFRVWHSPDGVRIAHITLVGERDLVVNGEEAWWWDGGEMTATRLRFEDIESMAREGLTGWMTTHGNRPPSEGAAAAALAADPVTAASQAIELLAPYASVSVGGDDEVAGRPVYTLVLTPVTDETLISRIELSIDAESRLPVRFEVVSRATGEAAISVGFSSVSFDAIDRALFSFSPPVGAEVNDALDDARASPPPSGMPSELDEGPGDVRVFGDGFATRIAIPLTDLGEVPPELAQLLPYAGPLASALVADVAGQRWFLAGAVALETLRSDVAGLS